MSEPTEKSVSTPYGETTIDVIECDSCGNEVALDETVEFTLGDREGRACQHCYEEGPVSFPNMIITEGPESTFEIVIVAILFPIFLLPVFFDALNGSDIAVSILTGMLAVLLWVVLPLLVFGVI